MNTSLHKPPTTSDEAISTREQKRSCRKGDSAIEKEGEPPGEWMSDRLLKGSKLRRMEKMNLQTKKKRGLYPLSTAVLVRGLWTLVSDNAITSIAP